MVVIKSENILSVVERVLQRSFNRVSGVEPQNESNNVEKPKNVARLIVKNVLNDASFSNAYENLIENFNFDYFLKS